MNNKTELIFMKWKAELADMDRTRAAVEGNFELLFDQLSRSKVKMNDALPYVDRAIKAHYPSDFILKNTYKKRKAYSSETMSEFESSWKDLIASTAKRVFFSFYEIEGVEVKSESAYGGMSSSEYRKQQRYADSHPTIDWESLVREKKELELLIIKENQEQVSQVDLKQVRLDIDLGDL